MNGLVNNLALLWIAIFIAFVIIEALTTQLVTIWFAFGAFVSFVVYLFGLSFGAQVCTFVVTSIVSLLMTYPLLKKFKHGETHPLNADMLLGESGIVISEKVDEKTFGQVKVKTQIWSALTNNDVILHNEEIIVKDIVGAHLVVGRKEG